MTINAAHKYLGLTTEVIRTEEAINRIASHPLPPSFYEGGGLEHLRHKFDKQSGSDSPPDYFKFDHSSESVHQFSDDAVFVESPIIQPQPLSGSSRESMSFNRTNSSRHAVQAGDLHTSTGLNDPFRGIHRAFSTLGPRHGPTRSLLLSPLTGEEGQHLGTDEFDLREEVMSCIAKSIGLHQPPISEPGTREASPTFSAIGSQYGDRRSPIAINSFPSLSLLETGDDMSTATGESTAVSSQGLSILDNEVQILYFTAGTTLARKGERHPGQSAFSCCREETHQPLLQACFMLLTESSTFHYL